MLRSGIVGVKGSMVVRLRPCMMMSTPPAPLSSRTQTLYGNKYLDHTMYTPSDGGDLAVGALYLTLTLGSLSNITLAEVNPLDIPEFISSIGGFWGECRRTPGPTKLPADDIGQATHCLGLKSTSSPFAVVCISWSLRGLAHHLGGILHCQAQRKHALTKSSQLFQGHPEGRPADQAPHSKGRAFAPIGGGLRLKARRRKTTQVGHRG